MLKINLITKHESDQLQQLREIDNYIQIQKITIQFQIAINEYDRLIRSMMFGYEAGYKLRQSILKLKSLN